MTQEQPNIWMDISEASRFHSPRYVIPIFQNKDSKSRQYGGISSKESDNPRMQRQDKHTDQDKSDGDTFQDLKEKYDNPPDDSNLTSFEEDKCSGHQKHWLSNIIQINFSTIRSIDISGSKQAL